ncbi:unnamed protein product, partial [Medioppia subpectinata]
PPRLRATARRTHQKVFRLNVAVYESAAVDGGQHVDGLHGNHQQGFGREFLATELEQLLQIGPESVHDHDVTQLRPQMYAKNSFDRFGDDLVRLILSYLSFNSFEEKSLHESVSKQFRKVIYDTINDISIRHEVIVKMRAEDTDLLDEQLCRKLIVFLQKKCPNVQT